MSSKYLKKHEIPFGFQELLSDFTKEILRNQPLDIIDFGCEYFRCMEENCELNYSHKGDNLPCDFKTIIPKRPQPKKKLELSKEDEERYKASLKKINQPVPLPRESLPPSEKKKEEISKKVEPPVQNIQPQIEPQPKLPSPEKKEIKKELPKEIPKELPKELPKEIPKEEEKVFPPTISPKKDIPPLNEVPSNIKEVSIKTKTQAILNSVENVPVDNEKCVTLPSEEQTLYENCIDVRGKEAILNDYLSKNDSSYKEIEDYYNNTFLPNKELNDLLIMMMSFPEAYYTGIFKNFNRRYSNLNNDINIRTEEVKAAKKLPICTDKNILKLELNKAVGEFKNFDYYQRLYLTLFYRLRNINNKNDGYLDQFCYFLFAEKLKEIVNKSNMNEILKKFPYLKNYFITYIRMLLPEIYGLVTSLNYITYDDFYSEITEFSVRKRELCQNFLKFYYSDKVKPEIYNQINDSFDKFSFISSLTQILEKLNSTTPENKKEVYEIATEKLSKNYSKIWRFIQTILDIPIENITIKIPTYESFTNLEREVVLKYLSLNEDYSDRHSALSEVEKKTNSSHVEFMKILSNISNQIKHTNDEQHELRLRYEFKSLSFPDEAKKFIEDYDKTEDVNEIFKKYLALDKFLKDAFYYYFTILVLVCNKDKDKELFKKISLEKNLRDSFSFANQVSDLADNFTPDTDEFEEYKKKYEVLKGKFNENIQEFIKGENKDKVFEGLCGEDKITALNLLDIEATLYGGKEGEYEKYAQQKPEADKLIVDIKNYAGKRVMKNYFP